MKKNQKTPEEKNLNNFHTELDRLMPQQFGTQLVISTLVKKYFTPKANEVVLEVFKKKRESVADSPKNS